jgi:peroxiredoxin
MKKWLFLLLAVPQFAFSQTSKSPGAFTIEGKLDGYPDGVEIQLYKNQENTPAATTKLVKGKFTIKGSVIEPILCFLVIGEEKPAEIYVENRIISFKGDKSQPGIFQVEGSQSHKEFSGFIKTFLPLAQQMSTLAGTINNTMPGKDRDALMETYNKILQNIQVEIDRFVNEKPASYVTPFLLNATYQFNEDPMVLEARFDKLTEMVRTSEAGKQLSSFIAENKIGAVGTQSLDFTQPDTSGAPVSLSSFRGKYVLVDFWASWCGPCRDENPNVVKSFNQFRNKNFTVLGVSLDRPGQKDKWIRAIHDDQLTWTHVSDLQFWNNSAAQLYKIRGIPQNILVDPSGKIVAKNLRGPALEAKLCEILGCN